MIATWFAGQKLGMKVLWALLLTLAGDSNIDKGVLEEAGIHPFHHSLSPHTSISFPIHTYPFLFTTTFLCLLSTTITGESTSCSKLLKELEIRTVGRKDRYHMHTTFPEYLHGASNPSLFQPFVSALPITIEHHQPEWTCRHSFHT